MLDQDYFDYIEQQVNQEYVPKTLEEIEEQEAYNKAEELKLEYEQQSNKYYIQMRKNRELIKYSFKIRKILIGDVIEFLYHYKNYVLIFTGICIAIRRKSFVVADMSIILRNIVMQTGMELTYSYFYNRAYKMKLLDHKRKIFTFNKNKIYFIRDRVNRESRVF